MSQTSQTSQTSQSLQAHLHLSPSAIYLFDARGVAKRFRHAAIFGALGACRTWGVDSENRPQRGQFLPDLQPHGPAMGQKDGEKLTAAVDSQPTLPKPDRLLDALQPGETMRFVNDHDPLPLLDQLRARYGDRINIDYLQREPGAIAINFGMR